MFKEQEQTIYLMKQKLKLIAKRIKLKKKRDKIKDEIKSINMQIDTIVGTIQGIQKEEDIRYQREGGKII